MAPAPSTDLARRGVRLRGVGSGQVERDDVVERRYHEGVIGDDLGVGLRDRVGLGVRVGAHIDVRGELCLDRLFGRSLDGGGSLGRGGRGCLAAGLVLGDGLHELALAQTSCSGDAEGVCQSLKLGDLEAGEVCAGFRAGGAEIDVSHVWGSFHC
jgi:hypothetical protein